MQIVGIPGGDKDRHVVTGDGSRFSVFGFVDGRLVTVESVNDASGHMAARRIFEGSTPSYEDCRAHDFDLRAIVRSAPRPAARAAENRCQL